MSQIFHPSTNTFAKASIFGAIFIFAGIAGLYALFIRSPYVTGVGVVRQQPVPFSHEHHVNGLGIDCRYCHTAVTDAAFAGMPSTHTCMTCHSQVWTNAETLAPVRQSWEEGVPIPWIRVHHLNDTVYFNHSIHVQKGVGCETCHGRVDRMPLTWKAETMHMEWCLECHREPWRYLRPQTEVFTRGWEVQDQEALGRELMQAYGIANRGILEDCTTCHN